MPISTGGYYDFALDPPGLGVAAETNWVVAHDLGQPENDMPSAPLDWLWKKALAEWQR